MVSITLIHVYKIEEVYLWIILSTNGIILYNVIFNILIYIFLKIEFNLMNKKYPKKLLKHL
jgi:DNA-directed RNA polymerase subunit E'/Rpb7